MDAHPDDAPTVRVITLGTAGGPQWWRERTDEGVSIRFGISTAIVVGDAVYLVDAGYGAAYQLARAGYSMRQVRAIFLTHLHSDHTADLPAMLLFAPYEAAGSPHLPIPVIGPAAHRVTDDGKASSLVVDGHVNGVSGMITDIERAFGADLFDRTVHGLREPVHRFFDVCELEGDTDTIVAYSDSEVIVRAASVDHATMRPAFAFRFEADGGTVTISGDTAPCERLIRLASGSDLLLHEAIDQGWLDRTYPADAPLTAQQRASSEHHEQSHSTVAQACEVADRAGVDRLVLHHLVPGDLPRDVWQAAASRQGGSIHVADDLDVFAISRAVVPITTDTPPL